MTALYRTYRPQTFADVIGQQHIKTTLLRELQTNQIAHAYLLCGPRGLGKTTVARLIAKAVNCHNLEKGNGEPCNTCEACVDITSGQSLDVLEIDAASHTGVDNVREEIVATARFNPSKRKYKVYIIDEVHMLSTSAFNALLKTLEEPPVHAIFVLATTEIHKVPQTIISRCQRFDFRKVSRDELLKRLDFIVGEEKKKIDADVLESIVRLSEGCVRDAESLLGQLLTLDDSHITTEQASMVLPISRNGAAIAFLQTLVDRNAEQAITLTNQLVQDGVDVTKFLQDVLELARKLLLAKIGTQLSEYSRNFDAPTEKQIMEMVVKVTEQRMIQMIQALTAARQEMKTVDIIQLPIEVAIIKLCDGAEPTVAAKPVQPVSQKPPQTPAPSIKVDESKKIPPAPIASVPVKSVEVPEESVDRAGAVGAPPELAEIKKRWQEVITLVKGHNLSLASTLRMHPPAEISSKGALVLHCQYAFHFDRINDSRNKLTLEKVLSELFLQPMRVEPTIVERVAEVKVVTDTDQTAIGSNQTMDAILKAFGGQVVE